jgi:hypothetical protein
MLFTPLVDLGKGVIFGPATETVSNAGPSLPIPFQVELPWVWVGQVGPQKMHLK